MGAILAKQQFRVLIIEESSHPRFTIGESSIPETSLMNRIIADRYGIPELGHITSFYSTQRYVSSSTGIKRNFGFVSTSRPGARPEGVYAVRHSRAAVGAGEPLLPARRRRLPVASRH
ncbi:hypothetical protein [Pseudomonas protegens]|uniref:hypothetical protein n=1 Tax=Pseudomonas protegens TaxID=380021 RepID=UPI001F0776EB|nr:hypothetical protein [Pseudomonas protegens]